MRGSGSEWGSERRGGGGGERGRVEEFVWMVFVRGLVVCMLGLGDWLGESLSGVGEVHVLCLDVALLCICIK